MPTLSREGSRSAACRVPSMSPRLREVARGTTGEPPRGAPTALQLPASWGARPPRNPAPTALPQEAEGGREDEWVREPSATPRSPSGRNCMLRGFREQSSPTHTQAAGGPHSGRGLSSHLLSLSSAKTPKHGAERGCRAGVKEPGAHHPSLPESPSPSPPPASGLQLCPGGRLQEATGPALCFVVSNRVPANLFPLPRTVFPGSLAPKWGQGR